MHSLVSFQRQADKAVHRGCDITGAESLLQVVDQPSSAIKFFHVTNESVEAMAKEIPDVLPTLPGTMSLHQLSWSQLCDQELRYRDVSCLCGEAVCDCSHKTFQFSSDAQNVEELVLDNADNVDVSVDNVSYIGKYVAVRYDDHVYPGIALDEDDSDVKVKCMYNVGPNRFLWPKRDDVIWYDVHDIVAVIPEPMPVTKRHLQVDPKVWGDIMMKFN